MSDANWTVNDPINYMNNCQVITSGSGRDGGLPSFSPFFTPQYMGLSSANLPTPADVFLLWDCDHGGSGAHWTDDYTTSSNVNSLHFRAGNTTDNDDTVGRHFGGENYAFCDGHVKWYSQASVSETDPRWDVH